MAARKGRRVRRKVTVVVVVPRCRGKARRTGRASAKARHAAARTLASKKAGAAAKHRAAVTLARGGKVVRRRRRRKGTAKKPAYDAL